MTKLNDDLTRELAQTRDDGISDASAHEVEQDAPEPTKADVSEKSQRTTASTAKKASAVVAGAIKKIEGHRVELCQGVGALDNTYVALTTDIVKLAGTMSPAAERRLVSQVRSEGYPLKSRGADAVAALFAVASRGMPRTVKGSLSKCKRIAREAIASGKDVLTLLAENNGHFWSIYDKLPKAPRKAQEKGAESVTAEIPDNVAQQLNEGLTAVVTWFNLEAGKLVQSVIPLDAILGLLNAAPPLGAAEAQSQHGGLVEEHDNRLFPNGQEDLVSDDAAREAESARGTAYAAPPINAPLAPPKHAGEISLEIGSALEDANDADPNDEAQFSTKPQAVEAASPRKPSEVGEMPGADPATEADKSRNNREAARNGADAVLAQGALPFADARG